MRFAVSERDFPIVQKYAASRPLPVQVVPARAGDLPIQGVLNFVDNGIDTTTGTVTLKARFDNGARSLWPGQFVQVSLELFVQPDAVLVPGEAVLTGQEGTFVFVVDDKSKAVMRPVVAGRAVGRQVLIERGLGGGERVVVDGQARIAPGATVEVRAGAGGRGPRGGHAMNFTGLFIRRPGHDDAGHARDPGLRRHGVHAAPVSDLPNVDYPTITVNASLPGASPETMAAVRRDAAGEAVLDDRRHRQHDVEHQLPRRDVDHASSSRSTATSTPPRRTCSRRSAKTLRDAAAGHPSAVAAEGEPGRRADPLLRAALADAAALELDEYARDDPRAADLDGQRRRAGQVYGSQKYAVRVQLDPRALAARGIGIEEVAAAVAQGNVNLPTGVLVGPEPRATRCRPTASCRTPAQFGELIVAYRNGAPVRLGDVGRVTDDVQNNRAAAWYNGTRSIMLAIQRQPGTNTVEVARAVKALLPTLRAQLPPSVEIDTFYDRSAGIEESVHDVKFTLVLDARARRARDLPVPAQRPRRRSSRASRCRCRSSARSR